MHFKIKSIKQLLSYIKLQNSSDALTKNEALAILKANKPSQNERGSF